MRKGASLRRKRFALHGDDRKSCGLTIEESSPANFGLEIFGVQSTKFEHCARAVQTMVDMPIIIQCVVLYGASFCYECVR